MNALQRFNAGRPPCGWVKSPVTGGFGLRHESGRIRIEAVKTTSEGERPSVGRGHRWELRRRQFAGEASSVRTLDAVETRSEAIEALYDYAERAVGESIGSTERTPTGAARGRLGEPNP